MTICEFINVEFQPEMLNTEGVFENLLEQKKHLLDPEFLKHIRHLYKMNVIDVDTEYEYLEHTQTIDQQPTEPVDIMVYEQFLEKMYESEKKLDFTNQFIKMIKDFTSHYFLPIADRIDQFV